nr:hypothetical protein [Tanacetum cinerariifolium]
GNNSLGTKKYQGSNNNGGGNAVDGVKIIGGVIRSGGEIGLDFPVGVPILPVTNSTIFESAECLARQYSRRARIAQSSALLTVADEPASPVRDVSKGEACPTDFGCIADQDRATIAKSSTLPHASAPRAQEEVIVRLKERVQVLEDREGVAAKQSRDDAPIKGRSINEGEAAAERISNDSEDIA